MQNKGIVKFIAAALVLICIFYLSFSFVTAHYDNKANELGIEAGLKEGKNFINNMASKDDAAWLNANEAAVNTAIEKAFADGSRAGMNYVNENAALKEHSDLVASVIDRAVVAKEQAAQAYIESLSGKDANVWFGKSLKQCREMEMGLGLDLKGGMNVILEVSVPDIFDNLASNNKKDPQFREIMELAKQKEEQTPGGNFVNIFYDTWKEKVAERPWLSIHVSDYILRKATPEQKAAGADVADILIAWKLNPCHAERSEASANPLLEEIRRYISPEYLEGVMALIEDLDLEIVSVNRINPNAHENPAR